MTHRSTRLTGTLLLATCVAFVGCSKRPSADSAPAEEPAPAATPKAAPEPAPEPGPVEHESKLVGVYKIDSYQHSEVGCDRLEDVEPQPLYAVLYGFHPSSNPQEVRLGGAFCSELSLCRALAKQAPEPVMGYSFITGDDEAGWQGFAISGVSGVEDKCVANVQSHLLTTKAPKSIHVETKTVRTLFDPVIEGDTATCHNRAALDSLRPELTCTSMLVLDATFEAAL